ncbi:unnamed protein product [Paramecium octaurelia]|uniref:Uncharacterized protein n=1 Tax=Paramecium octaurelia TaxID=43137 RepID=A0A8S1V719_PAROT|nr:unnamed protein product [Paramecium octaurelia]
MLTNQRSKPKLKPVFKFKYFLKTIGLPEILKDQSGRLRNSVENNQFPLYQHISSSVRKNSSTIQQSLLPSVTNRKSLVIEPISYSINNLDHLIPDKSIKNKKKNYKKFKNLSIYMNSNEYINLTNDELQAVQSIKNSPNKQQTNNKSQDQKKTRKQKLIEFLKGQHQNMQFTTILQRKNQKDQAVLPSFIITKYQELQF